MSDWSGAHGVPDLLAGGPRQYIYERLVPCRARMRGFVCNRRAGHTGRHAAGTGVEIVAVWREDER